MALGDNTYGQRFVNWTNIQAIAAGLNHTVGLRKTGTVAAAGYNAHGQCNVTGWTDIIAVAAGHNHTVGLKKNGTPIAAGDNHCGQCDVQKLVRT